jgi:hypothetical protein
MSIQKTPGDEDARAAERREQEAREARSGKTPTPQTPDPEALKRARQEAAAKRSQ